MKWKTLALTSMLAVSGISSEMGNRIFEAYSNFRKINPSPDLSIPRDVWEFLPDGKYARQLSIEGKRVYVDTYLMSEKSGEHGTVLMHYETGKTEVDAVADNPASKEFTNMQFIVFCNQNRIKDKEVNIMAKKFTERVLEEMFLQQSNGFTTTNHYDIQFMDSRRGIDGAKRDLALYEPIKNNGINSYQIFIGPLNIEVPTGKVIHSNKTDGEVMQERVRQSKK